MNDDMQHEPEAETYDPAFVRDLEAEVRHEDQLFAAHCAAMDASIADDCAPRPTGRPRVPDWASSRLNQQKLRQQTAVVLAVRNARLRNARLLTEVLSRARSVTPHHSTRQRGAVTRSTAKSGDSNSDDGGDPDPDDVLIADPAASDSRVLKHPDPSHRHRTARKAVAAMRLLDTGLATPRQQHAANFYFSGFTVLVRRFFSAPRFRRLGRDTLDLAAPLIATATLHKLAENHDFQKTPNPNLKAILSKNFFKVSDVSASVRAAASPDGSAAGLCVADMLERGGKDVDKPELRMDFLSVYDTHQADEKMAKAEAVMQAEAEAAGYTYIPAVRSSVFMQQNKDHDTERHFSREYVSALRADDSPDDDLPDDEDAVHGSYACPADKLSEVFVGTADELDALEAAKAGNTARQIVRYVLTQPDRQQAILDAAMALSELDDERVLLALSRDKANANLVADILALVGYDYQPVPDPVAEEEAERDLEEDLLAMALQPDELLVRMRAHILSRLVDRHGFANSGNLRSKLKTRAENRYGKFPPEVQRVAHILWAKGGAA